MDAGSGHAIVVGTRLDGAARVGGSVSVLDVTSGRVLQTRGIALFPQGVTLDVQRGRAFVSSPGSNSVSVLDTRHGLLLRTTHVGTNPTTPIVDEQTGRVFVASAAAATVSVLDAGTGRLLRTVALGPAAGTALVGLGLWAGPDSMEHIVTAGAEPGLVAVAERAGLRRHEEHDGPGRHVPPVGAGVMPLRAWWSLWVQWAHTLQRWLPQQARRALPGLPPQVAADMVPGSATVLDTARV